MGAGVARRGMAGIALMALFACPQGAEAKVHPWTPGSVRFVKPAESDFAPFIAHPSRAHQAWMRAHYWRMRTYPPYFDRRLRWYRQAWAYRDLYAIYRGSALARRHPGWILRDPHRRRLYIPFGCDGRSCPQYAGDIANPGFRRYWIGRARRTLRKGYVGLFIDDVNAPMAVGDATGRWVAPIDRRTRRPMTKRAWRRYLALFTRQIRRSLHRAEIVHNSLWVAGDRDRYTRQQLGAADLIELERGATDPGMRGGSGTFGYERFLRFIDHLHARRKGVLLDGRAPTDPEREYGLASYFLISSGRDAIGNDPGSTPHDWWRGYDVQLGGADGPRYRWQSLLRRDFVGGMVLVNQPDAPTVTVDLGAVWTNADRRHRFRTVSLRPASGVVLVPPRGSSGGGAPAPPPPHSQPYSPPPSSPPPSSPPPTGCLITILCG